MIVILGPTGTGKSEISINLAHKIDGEIINADSRQIYRGMTIGTAKPNLENTKSVPHHLFDCKDPDENFSVFEFKGLVSDAACEIQSRGKIPILVGGTGQYLIALLENWTLDGGPPNPQLREHLSDRLSRLGLENLVEELTNTSPDLANTIDLHNPRRVIRALEKIHNTDNYAKTSLQNGLHGLAKVPIFGIQMPRNRLYPQVDSRADKMIRNGWIPETQTLLDSGYGTDLSAMGGIGYKEISEYLLGNSTWAFCISKIKSRTHRLIRTQSNWFRRIDRSVTWFDSHELNPEEISDRISRLMT